MLARWIGPLVTLLIVGGIAVILFMNLETGRPDPRPGGGPTTSSAGREPRQPPRILSGPFREYPIGDEVEKNFMRIAAVWLPSVEVEGMDVPSGSDVIHVEADIQATEGNPHGFTKDGFVPYLKIRYRIEPSDGGPPLQGDLFPMVARDGLHYGVNLGLPKPGPYRLTYRIEPPSAGGLGRHHDPVTGVAPWWSPFEVSFDWDYPGPQGSSPSATSGDAPALR